VGVPLQKTLPGGYVPLPPELITVKFKLQLCPPIFKAKLAVPLLAGVPVIV
jgi:hypothetical protein